MAAVRRPSLARLINRLAAGGDHRAADAEDRLDALAAAVEADGYGILTVHKPDGRVRITAARGLKHPVGDRELQAPDLTRHALGLSGRPALRLTGSFDKDPFLSGERARSVVIACGDADDVVSLTLAIRRKPEAFTPAEADRFGAVGALINLHTHIHHLQESLRRQQEKDPLTGFIRFMSFHGALSREVARARRTGRHLAVGVLSYENSGAGDPDRHVRSIASIIREQLRSFDVIARYGPRQFSFVLPDLTAHQGMQVSQRLLGSLDRGVPADADDPRFFIGVSSYPEDASSADRLIEIAEAAMAQAREAGTPGVFGWEHGDGEAAEETGDEERG